MGVFGDEFGNDPYGYMSALAGVLGSEDAVPIGLRNRAAGVFPMGAIAGGRSAPMDQFGAAPLKPASPASAGIRAYHGSPHDFNEFKSEAIGTGEGAQAYGHGLYFAQNEGVAKGYRDTLSNRDAAGYATAHLNAQNLVKKVGGDAQYAAEVLRDQMNALGPSDANYSRLQDTLKFVEDGSYAKPLPQGGHMYEVSIKADPEHFLDWDKPLSEQSPKVQRAFGQVVGRNISEEPGWAKLTGEQALKAAVERGGRRGEGEAALKQAGIPGIKYLDAGSRGAGDGSRNFVAFDPAIIQIVSKYGIGAAIAAGLISQEQGDAIEAQRKSGRI